MKVLNTLQLNFNESKRVFVKFFQTNLYNLRPRLKGFKAGKTYQFYRL